MMILKTPESYSISEAQINTVSAGSDLDKNFWRFTNEQGIHKTLAILHG
jgi:hypothetical protein